MTDTPRKPRRKSLRTPLIAALTLVLVTGVAVAANLDRRTDDQIPTREGYGTLRTVELHGVGATGCVHPCPEYDIFTNFKTRTGAASQFTAIVAGPVSEGGPLLFNGHAATLVDVDGNLVAEIDPSDQGLRTVFRRIRTGAVADFDRDGHNEILYGLNSFNIYETEASLRNRQRNSLELLRTATGDPRDYVSISDAAFPMEACPLERANPCPRVYDWVIDGDVIDVAVADFDRDGWLDIAYLGTSLGDHSWIGFDHQLEAVGVPLSNENGARIGLVMNRGADDPGVFTWPRSTSSIETYLKELYPASDEIDYAPKSRRLLATDLDRDGNVDMVVVGEKIVVGWGDGRGGFPLVEDLADTPGGSDAVVADLDRDGNLDVFVLADSQTRYIDLPRVACGDNSDPAGHPCAVRGRNEGGVSAIYRGDGRRGLLKDREFAPITRPTSVSALDVDGNGWLDLLVTCEACAGPGVLRAVTDGERLQGYDVEALSSTDAHQFMQRSLTTDVDADGDVDAVITGSGPAFRQVWTNGTTTGNDTRTAPVAPVIVFALGLALILALTALLLRRLIRRLIRRRRTRPRATPGDL